MFTCINHVQIVWKTKYFANLIAIVK